MYKYYVSIKILKRPLKPTKKKIRWKWTHIIIFYKHFFQHRKLLHVIYVYTHTRLVRAIYGHCRRALTHQEETQMNTESLAISVVIIFLLSEPLSHMGQISTPSFPKLRTSGKIISLDNYKSKMSSSSSLCLSSLPSLLYVRQRFYF